MTDTSEEIKSLLIGLAVIAVIFQYNHPKTEYEVNGIVVAETECIKKSKSTCYKKLEKIKITYTRNSSKVLYMLYDLDGEPNQSIYELDKCVVMNEEIFGCAGLVRRGDAIAIDSEKTGAPKHQFGFHQVITSKVFKFMPNASLYSADQVNFLQEWIF
jgi:hypothetical protein